MKYMSDVILWDIYRQAAKKEEEREKEKEGVSRVEVGVLWVSPPVTEQEFQQHTSRTPHINLYEYTVQEKG